MSDALNTTGQFKPIHDAHAIEQVVFNLQFDRPVDDVIFLEAGKAAEQFLPELPGRNKTQALTFQPGALPVPNSGILFRKVAPDGATENELRVDRNSLSFRTTLYSRWDAIWSQANKYFNALIPIYAAQARLIGISISYIDKFEWQGDLTACRPSLLLRAQSRYLCPHVFDAKDFWHSHTGAFIRVDNNTKRLLNINVDYLDESRLDEVRRIVAITTALADQLDQPEYEPYFAEGNDIIKLVDEHMQSLHVFGKEVFGDIINDEMCKRIALVK